MTEIVPIPKKTDRTALLVTAFFACLLGFVVVKEIEMPQWVLITAIVTGSLVLLIKSLSQPELVTYALVAYLPFSRELAGDFAGAGTALNLTNVLLVFITLVWISGRYAKDEPLWLKTPVNGPLIMFLLLGLASVFRGTYFGSDYIGYAIIEYKRWTTPFVLYFFILNTVKERETIKNIVFIIVLVCTVAALMAIYDYIEVGNVSSLEKARVGGIVDQPNMLAAFFNYYMFIPFGFFIMNMSKIMYWGLLIPFLLQFRGIMVTFSRGGYLAFALALYAITFFRSRILFLLLLAATGLAVLNPMLLPAGIRYRMGQTLEHKSSYSTEVEFEEENLESSSRTRVEIWKAGLQIVKDYPMWGVGYGLFQAALSHYWEGGERDAHNTYLIIAAEMGIPALIVFLWLIWIIFWHTWHLYRKTKDPYTKALTLGYLGGIFGLLMSNMFGSRLDSQEVASYFWILAALIMRLKIIEDKENNVAPIQKIGYGLQGNSAL